MTTDLLRTYTAFIFLIFVVSISQAQQQPRYLINDIHFADPSAHIFNQRIYIYPSHDVESKGTTGLNGDHYDMKDYHVLSMQKVGSPVTDHGVALSLEQIQWAKKQLWAPDCAEREGKYYLYFPAKDHQDIFKIGVAISDQPEGPFIPQQNPIAGAYSIDPTVFKDKKEYYLIFGGISGGQLQRYSDNQYLGKDSYPLENENALSPKIARLKPNMLELAEHPKDLLIVDENGDSMKAGDKKRRFFEGAWIHQYNDKYYLSYSTGDSHQICYAISNSLYGPYQYQGVILTPVSGWTTHHSIIEIDKQWYLIYHDSKLSGKSYLRNIKMRPLEYQNDGRIITLNGAD